MGRELQKRKRRSSRAKVRPNNPHKKQLNPQSNTVIAKNWNKKETLSQNYRRLGLVARLNGATGGTERARLLASAASGDDDNLAADRDFSSGLGSGANRTRRKLGRGFGDDATAATNDAGGAPFAIPAVGKAIFREARVERDPESGRIVRVIHEGRDGGAGGNPLGDALKGIDSDDDDDDEEDEEMDEGEDAAATATPSDHPILAQLEAQAADVRPTRRRHQSEREREWLGRLVAKHGLGNEAAMVRDRLLNPFQQTEADLKRRLRVWRELEGGGEEV